MLRTRLPPRAAARFSALAVFCLTLVAWPDARASVSIAVTWEGLLRESTAAVFVTPMESRSVWENGRIYTYTHVRIDRSAAGELGAGADPWVRTMGGIVGKIGQLVEGEAVLVPGQSSLVFLRTGPIGAFEVTARGQGQFPVARDGPKSAARVVRSQGVGLLMQPRVVPPAPPPQLAADLLHGRLVDDVALEIATAWSRTHAH
jgi:hypothetical protein